MTDVKTLVRATAQHVRITTLAKGDCYKRLEPANSYTKAEMLLGVVTDIMSDGDTSVITAIEYHLTYGEVKPKLVTLVSGDETPIFPADPEEVLTYFDELETLQRSKIERIERELAEARRTMNKLVEVGNSYLSKPAIEPVEIVESVD